MHDHDVLGEDVIRLKTLSEVLLIKRKTTIVRDLSHLQPSQGTNEVVSAAHAGCHGVGVEFHLPRKSHVDLIHQRIYLLQYPLNATHDSYRQHGKEGKIT